MADQSLTEFFLEIADAIREVEGSSDEIPAPEFPDRIRNLSASSGVDASGLKTSIAAATAAKSTAKVQGQGDYDFGTNVATQGAIDILTAAIAKAQAAYDVYGTETVYQEDIDAAKRELDAALETFNASLVTLSADTTALTAQESRYETLSSGVTVSADGKDVAFGSKWVTSSAKSAAETAIENARSSVASATKQSQVDAAVATLKSALGTYESAIRTATKDTAALDAAISAANSAKTGVQISDSEGSDLPGGSQYVTNAEMKALTDAIAAANSAKTGAANQNAIDAATSALTAATQTFKSAIKTNSIPVPSDQAAFNATSWEDMAELSAQCAKDGTSDYEKLLGFTKDVSITGVGTVKAKLIGLNHDDLVSGGKAGFTFQLTDGLSTSKPVAMQMNASATNSGGWASSAMRTTNLPKLRDVLPSDLKDVIKKVKKKTSTANSGTAVSETEDDLFLLSLVESIGTTKTAYTDNPIATGNYLNFEGAQYEYYKQFDANKTNAFNAHIIKQDSGSAQYWWLRSINLGGTTNFYNVYTSGDWNRSSANNSYLPAAGFAL